MPFTKSSPKIYYEVEGDPNSPSILFIGGMIYSQKIWLFQREYFKERFFTIFLDNRDSGKSEKARSSYTIKDMANDVLSVMDAIGTEKANIIGASMGGFIAQDIAAFYPERVEKLVLICTHYGCEDYKKMTEETWKEIFDNKGLSVEEIYLKGIRYSVSKDFFEKRKDIVDVLLNMMKEFYQDPFAFFRQFEAASNFCSKGYLGSIKAPTLIIGGNYDVLVPKPLIRALSEYIPNSKAVFLDAGHLVFLEKPDIVNKEIERFLK